MCEHHRWHTLFGRMARTNIYKRQLQQQAKYIYDHKGWRRNGKVPNLSQKNWLDTHAISILPESLTKNSILWCTVKDPYGEIGDHFWDLTLLSLSRLAENPGFLHILCNNYWSSGGTENYILQWHSTVH